MRDENETTDFATIARSVFGPVAKLSSTQFSVVGLAPIPWLRGWISNGRAIGRDDQ